MLPSLLPFFRGGVDRVALLGRPRRLFRLTAASRFFSSTSGTGGHELISEKEKMLETLWVMRQEKEKLAKLALSFEREDKKVGCSGRRKLKNPSEELNYPCVSRVLDIPQKWLRQQEMQAEYARHDAEVFSPEYSDVAIPAPTSPKLGNAGSHASTSSPAVAAPDTATAAASDNDNAHDITDLKDRERFLKRRAVAAFEEQREELRAILEANSVAPTAMLMQDLLAWRIQL